ncbi:hypothetical protein SAMN05660845_2522 [Flavobacterium swingsii]|uniref:Uncharacterized protein n=1 Tax=Flavobacterium swingsii TaxID=498292 RepID=A0A1I1A056_9FLAO|nr:hypothetical protein [Flavobacterium swingsii]SFB30952.1 hypothetical protein SAMN05660845_2522 [Flavobacterium swingsii]
MKLEKTEQVIEGIDFHYILINHFKILENDTIDDLRQFTLDFANSDYFLDEYIANTKKEKKIDETNFLPFAFNVKKLNKNDFKLKKESVITFIEKSFIDRFKEDEFEPTDDFYIDFKFSIKVLDDYLKKYRIDDSFTIIDIDYFPNTSEKVTELYQEMGYIVDYFYFGVIPLKNKNEFVTFELAYE